MGMLTKLKSQMVNLRVFRPYFPIAKTLRDMVTFPWDYARGGKSRPYPSIINFNITTRCNLRCEFCFNKDNIVGKPGELSLDEIRRVIKQSAKHRPGFFLTGGEPFSRKDIFEIIDTIKRYSLPVGLVTNGMFLDEEKVGRLIRLGTDVVIVSFHGTEEVHDRVVGHKGAFQKSMAGLKLLASRMSPPGPMINYIISEQSIDSLQPFLDEAMKIDNLVIRLSHLNFLTQKEVDAQKALWAKKFPDVPLDILSFTYECDTERFRKVQQILDNPKYKDVFTKPILSEQDFANWYSNDFQLGRQCVFIWRSTFINADGTVYPCQFLYVPMGNVRDQNLGDIWNNDLYQRFRNTIKEGLMPGCSRCCKL